MTHFDANEDEVPSYRFGFSLDDDDPWIRVDGGDLPCTVFVKLGTPRAGRLVCTGLRIGAGDREEEYEVTGRMLRDVRLGNILRAIREGAGSFGKSYLSVPNRVYPPALAYIREHLGEDAAREYMAAAGKTGGEMMAGKAVPLAVRRGRKGLDRETLRRTAEMYRDVLEDGSTQPLAEMAAALDVWPSTVWRRLQKAWEIFPDLKPKEGTR